MDAAESYKKWMVNHNFTVEDDKDGRTIAMGSCQCIRAILTPGVDYSLEVIDHGKWKPFYNTVFFFMLKHKVKSIQRRFAAAKNAHAKLFKEITGSKPNIEAAARIMPPINTTLSDAIKVAGEFK